MNSSESGSETLEKALQIATQQLHALKEIGLLLESTLSFDEIITMAVHKTIHLMHAETMTIFLIEENGELVSRVIEGGNVQEIRLKPGQGLAGWTARVGKPVRVDDVYNDGRFDASWDHENNFHTRGVICHPIFGRTGSVIGIAEVLNKKEGSFSNEDLSLLGVLCGQLAMIIENSRMMVDLVAKNKAISEAKIRLERRNRELDLLLDIEHLLARAEDLNSLVTMVLGRVIEIADAGVGVLHKFDAEGAENRICVPGSQSCRVIRVEPGAGFTGWVAAKGQEINIDEPVGDPRFKESLQQRIGIDLRNLAVVPLPFSEGSTMRGSLAVANKTRKNGFDESDMILLRLVAAQLAAAIEHLAGREVRERERRLATVGRLLAGVLHDLKSPITVVSGYAELLASKVDGDEGREYMGRITTALRRISTMTTEIISFSKGDSELLIHSCSLETLINDLTDQIRSILDSNKIDLTINRRTSGTIRVDAEKMMRVFLNIVLNAVEAMPNGGKLVIDVDHIGRELIFSFMDTGGGVPEIIQGSLFQSFVTFGKEHGTGLGLAVVREIVEGHGGKVSFTTVKGSGTTFLISIPM